jgi:predicted phosphoribosyltransferase
VLDEKAIERMHIPRAALEHAIAHEREELSRRQQLYRKDRPPLALEGLTAILVDDGLATGYTMLAAVRAVRRLQASLIVVAVPVAMKETLEWLHIEADEAICVEIPRRLEAVGQFYEDFNQVSDEQVREELERSG